MGTNDAVFVSDNLKILRHILGLSNQLSPFVRSREAPEQNKIEQTPSLL